MTQYTIKSGIDFSGFIADCTRDFTGRGWVFTEIGRLLADPGGPPSSSPPSDNPDLTSLQWLVEAVRKAGRRIEILVTNPTDSTRRLKQEYDPGVYGYRLVEMEPQAHALTVELAA
jgi:hypothetical protein